MASTVRIRSLCAVVGGLLALGMTAAPAVAARDVPSDSASGHALYGCDQEVRDTGGLVKDTDPPAGSHVEPGQEIRVELTWKTGDWDASELHKVLDCVTLDGKLSSVLSGGEKPTANDGRFSHRYRVPGDAAPGTVVCDRGFLSGPTTDEDYARAASRTVCFTVEQPQGHRAGDVGPPAVPPAPAPAPVPAPAPPSSGEVAPGGLIGAGSPSPQPAPVAAPGPVLQAGAQLPRTGGTPPAGAALTCLALAALARRSTRKAG